jgi:two-component system, chemotaxis family, CheB/CheR fusion protein
MMSPPDSSSADSSSAGPVSPAPKATDPAAAPAENRPPAGEFVIVGIGASAGGLEAISEMLKRLPAESNLAIIVVQHLDPNHASILVDLLARVAMLPVQWAMNGVTIEPRHVYVAPPKLCLGLENNVLLLREPAGRAGGDVNHFFQALADDCKHRAVGVILSGNGSDGSFGAKAIKGAGGIVFAQEPASAAFPSMPRSAIEAKAVDRVLPPARIAEELIKLAQHVPILWDQIAAPEETLAAGSEAETLAAILRLLAARTGVDFNEYKQTTIKRRLVRQMALSKIGAIGDYLKLLQKKRDEVDKLYDSLLINVTDFFRDPEYFEFLRDQIFPKILKHLPENTPIRAWVPGCATGEEAYSLAMVLRELLDAENLATPVQIFGTDVSENAIAHARAGLYPTTDIANVSPERLKRFFHETDRGHAIRKKIRDMCVFARQNVAKDSPFSKLDLISCRNLLIYLNPKLQRKLMPIFHYALNHGGYLVLGSSESVGGQADLYRVVDRRFRIYARKSTSSRAAFEFAVDHHARTSSSLRAKSFPPMPDDLKEPFDITREADRIILTRHAPSGVLVNDELEILQFRGDVSAWLSPIAGRASLHLLRMAREGLAAELQAALNEAREKNIRVNRWGVAVQQGGERRLVDLDVTPIDTVQTKERFYLVLFTATDTIPAGGAPPKAREPKLGELSQMEQLRQDLEATRSYLQTAIEKHEATNQELRAANEEIQSSNEELQSTNEELETAKEELQSTNEELTTVNEELHSRQTELIQVNNDLTNLINSVHLPIIILGQDMRIRRFTPMAERVLNVIPTDIGRPLSDINTSLDIDNLPQLMREVVDSLTIKELEVQDKRGRWYSMRLRPYKTSENKIDGVVLTLIDIDALKRTIADAEEARDFAQAVVQSTPEPLAILTKDLRVRTANDAFARLFRTTPEKIEACPFFDLATDQAAMKDLRKALEGVLPTNASLTEYETRIDLPAAGSARLLVNARRISSAKRSYPLILLSLRIRATG